MITNSVLVIDAKGNALTPCTPARARIQLPVNPIFEIN